MKKKILIVEDNNDLREILNLFITKMGYEAIKAKNSNQAIAFAEAEEPHLIFMDMELPDVDGVKTTAILRKNPKTSHIPVVALSVWMSKLLREKASKVGIATYLLIPASPQTLKRTIEEYTNESFTRGKAMTTSDLNRAKTDCSSLTWSGLRGLFLCFQPAHLAVQFFYKRLHP